MVKQATPKSFFFFFKPFKMFFSYLNFRKEKTDSPLATTLWRCWHTYSPTRIVTNCFVPPMMAQPIKSKAPQLHNSPHYPTKPNNPILDNGLYLFIGQMWHPSSSIRPIESMTNNIIWTWGERNSTNQFHSAHCKTPSHLKPTHTHICQVFFFFFFPNKFCHFLGKILGNFIFF